jgi:deoxynucleoside triphosphate triphosphohydrolase SAMHD1
MAALMHDLGHGPFSHLFDRGVIPELLRLKNISRQSINNWEHEDASEMMFNHMIDTCGLDPEEDDLDPSFICRLIKGKTTPADQGRKWMYEIVANKRNSFDVDKLDYLARDEYHCRLQIDNQREFTHNLIIQNSRIIDDQIAYNIKIVNNIKGIYEQRYIQFKTIYSHKTA